MRHFLYAIASRKRRGVGYTDQHLKLWHTVKGRPVFLGNYRYHHESPIQAAQNAIAAFGSIPKRVHDADHPMGGRDSKVWAAYCTIDDISHTTVEWD